MDTDNDVPIPMLSKEHFAEAILDRMVQTGETLPLRYEPQGFRLASSDGHVFNLGNAYGEFSAAPPSKRAKILRHYVRGWLSRYKTIPAEFADAAPDLLPKIVHRFSVDVKKLHSQIDNTPPRAEFSQVFGEHFATRLVYDWPVSDAEIDLARLAAWKTTPEEALKIALENLAARSRETLKRVAPGVLMGTWQDDYDPCRLLLPEVMRRPKIKGDPVIMLPNSNSLLQIGRAHV